MPINHKLNSKNNGPVFYSIFIPPSLPSLAFYSHSVRKTAFFFTELVKITTSSLIMKCDTVSDGLLHALPSIGTLESMAGKKIMSLRNFVSMTDHFNFILLPNVIFFSFLGLSNHNVP